MPDFASFCVPCPTDPVSIGCPIDLSNDPDVTPLNVSDALKVPAAAPESTVLWAAFSAGLIILASWGSDSLAGTTRVVPSGIEDDSGCVRTFAWSVGPTALELSVGTLVEKASFGLIESVFALGSVMLIVQYVCIDGDVSV